MEILILGFWSQGPRKLDLRSNQGFKECPRESALCYTWCCHCCWLAMSWLCGWMNERVREVLPLLSCHTCSCSCSSEAGLCGLVRLSLSLR